MQYINPTTEAQSLYFAKPADYTSATDLQFKSYVANFSVTPSVTELQNFIQLTFSLSEEQAEYFTTGTEFNVSFGSAQDLVCGIVKNVTVIEYTPEDE